MAYVLDGDTKCNNIQGRDFNTIWKMINDKLFMEYANI